MTKTCTSLEQSKKLIELGIDINTADMCHRYRWSNNSFINLPCAEKAREPITGDIPAWSLTALLGLMPKLHEFENDSEDGGCQPNLCKGWDNNQWHVVYRSSIHITDWYDDPIDAAFEMICWLKENFDIYEH